MKRKTEGSHSAKRVRKKVFLIAGSFCLVLALGFLLPASFAANAAQEEHLKPGPRDKCPVCGMFVDDYPNWLGVIVFKDGSRAFFDGPKDLFKHLLDRKRYEPAGHSREAASIFVTDYYTVSPIDAHKAFYVAGSDVLGPMGRELIPLQKESDARTFLGDHKGKRLLRFHDITPEVLKGLD